MDGNTATRMDIRSLAEEVIFREAQYLDNRAWEDWVALYEPDAVFWVPSWASEDETTTDPELELNYFYVKGQGGLRDRVFRFDSGDSYASMPLPVTSHVVGTVLAEETSPDLVTATARWICISCDGRRGAVTRGGHYEYQLVHRDGGLRIKRKKVVLLEQVIDGTVDVYNI